MSQCVPDWDHHESPDLSSKLSTSTNPHPHCTPHSFSMLDEDYGVSELTWKNGQVCMNGLGNPPIAPAGRKQVIDILDNEKLLGGAGGGTLESIINQAAGQLQPINHTKTNLQVSPWFNHDDHHNVSNTTPTTTFDALVPSSTRTYSNDILDNPVPKLLAGVGGRHNNKQHVMREDAVISRKRKSVAISHHQDGSSSRNHSVAGSENSSLRKESNWQVDMTPAFTSTSLGSVPENTVSSWESFKEGGGTTMEGENKTKEKEREKSSGSTRRSRAAAIHNQSERKRRDKINQRMKTLQKLVPNSNKTDKASMLDEVIEYIKQLQAQVQSVSMAAAIPHMNMMMPQSMTTMQQQFQLLMMAQMTQMGMSMGMNMGSGMGPGMGSGMGPGMGSGMGPGMMDLSSMSMGRNIAGMPSFLPSTAVMPPDPLSALLATQSQQISRDQYSRIAALYQQMNQNQ